NELMQFARPSRPHRQLVDVGGLLRDVTAALGDLAKYYQVDLVCADLAQPVTLFADPGQLRTSLICLLRNAIEAAARTDGGTTEAPPVDEAGAATSPRTRWAGVRVDATVLERLDFVVEDSGNGPGPAEREHLFDPFYSGRKAGRGRGLGLA